MILLIDNNDSFTYNVVELVRQIGDIRLVVVKSSDVDIEEIEKYNSIIFSPGPGLPNDFPVMKQILSRYDHTKRILGICLGHQAICEYYGASLINLSTVMHGVESEIFCDKESVLFSGVGSTIVGRYHSWVATNIPPDLKITAVDKESMVMAVEHRTKNVFGIQFHPESYITHEGKQILKNFIYGATR